MMNKEITTFSVVVIHQKTIDFIHHYHGRNVDDNHFFFKSDFRNHDIIASQHHIATLDSPEMNYIFLAGDAIHYTVVPHILSK